MSAPAPLPEGASPQALLGSFAHELRGPLNVCVMWLELLELKASQPAEVQKAVEVMRRNLGQQAVLLRELDDIGRILGGGIELETREVDLQEMLQRALDGWRAIASDRDVQLVARLAAGPMLIDADPNRLLQAFGYWLENALAATPRGGRIEVELRRDGDAAAVIVTDNGTGLSSSDTQRFFARPLEGSRRQKTLGLRVVLAQELIAGHGGALAIASEGEDAGCTWTARLPLKR